MESLNDKELLDIYNDFVLQQIKILGSNGRKSPYFIIDFATLQKFSKRQLTEWNAAKLKHENDAVRDVWKILQQNVRKFKGTKKDKDRSRIIKQIQFSPQKPLARISVRNVRTTEKIHELGTFRSLCESNGLRIPLSHIKWYEDNDLISPLVRTRDASYYAVYQLHILMILEQWKQMTLEYPNPTYFDSHWLKVESSMWQDYLALNKENILSECNRYNDIVALLLDIRDLDLALMDLALKDISSVDPTQKPRTNLVEARMSYYAEVAGDHFATLLRKKYPKVERGIIAYWISQMAYQAVSLNPFLTRAREFPAILSLKPRLSLFRDAHGIKNRVELANWYLRTAKLLALFLECLSGEKASVFDIIDSAANLSEPPKEKLCEICGRSFIPTDRSGGKPQKICLRKSCAKTRDRKYSEKRRRKI